MRRHFKAYGEALDGVKTDVHGLRHEMDGLRHEMRAGFEQIDRRFDRVETRLDRVEGRLDRVETAALEHTREIKAIRVAVDEKVDRDEVRGIVERVVAGRSPDQKG